MRRRKVAIREKLMNDLGVLSEGVAEYDKSRRLGRRVIVQNPGENRRKKIPRGPREMG